MSDLAPLPPTPPGRYRHYKGQTYEVLGAVRHSETLEPLVLYRALYGEGGLWVRPHAMFFGQIEVDGCLQARFALVDGPEVNPSVSPSASAPAPSPAPGTAPSGTSPQTRPA